MAAHQRDDAPIRRGRSSLSARWRLTFSYTALFFVAAAVLLGLNYFLVQRSLNQNRDEIRVAVADQLGIAPDEVTAGENDADDRAVFRAVQHRIAEEHLEHLLTESAIALLVVTGASLALGWVIAGRVLRPVHRMTTTARQLSESNLHERIGLEGPDDELKELADTFDALLARLEAAFDAQRRFVADASHELRTPLAIIRAEIDVTLADPEATPAELRAMAETVRDATERSEHLIDSLLVLARSDAARLGTTTLDLATLAATAAAAVATDARDRSIEVELTLEPALVVGDASLLERAVANLVENAVRHNIDGGWVTVETSATDAAASIRVANSGAAMSAAEIDALFGRFARGDDARARGAPGFGLGLSIVAAVTSAHQGSLRAEPLPGGGLAITLALPAARDVEHDASALATR